MAQPGEVVAADAGCGFVLGLIY